MRGSALLPKQFRSLGNSDSWLNRNVTNQLISLSSIACQHPIHTIVLLALLASTSYVGLLQESLFDTSTSYKHAQGRVDVDALLQGSRTLELSQETGWKWHIRENAVVAEHDVNILGPVDSDPRYADLPYSVFSTTL